MRDLEQRIANLTPERWALLERRLKPMGSPDAEKPRIPRRETRGPCPLSFGQERLWFLDQMEPQTLEAHEVSD